MYEDLWNSLRLHKQYEYIPISYTIYGFKYRIHTHTYPSDLNMHIEIIWKIANELKVLRIIIKSQSWRQELKLDSIN